MSRIRQRSTLFPIGVADRVNNGVTITHRENVDYDSTYYYTRELCVDDLGKTVDHPLSITRTDRRGIVPLDGELFINPTTYRKFLKYIPSTQGGFSPGHLSTSIPSIGTVATAVLARSNPSRATLSLPNFVFELKDLPGMIRDIGRLKLLYKNRKYLARPVKESANYYLSYQMGWKPLISDLRKMLDFQSHVDKKMRELDRLYNNGGLQRKVRIPSWTQVVSSESAQTAESSITSDVTFNRTIITEIERWGTVRWYPSSRPSTRLSSKQLARLARRLAFGLRPSSKVVWDAIPWTWLIGWFSNADEFIQAHDNGIPLTHSVPCIMTRTTTNYFWRRTDPNTWASGGNSSLLYQTLERSLSSGTLSASIPFLTGRQLSILGALNIQRFKR